MKKVSKKKPKSKAKTAAPASPAKSVESAEENSFPIVGVGASAGGFEAFADLLRHLPEKTGMAFVFVQHLDPSHTSALVGDRCQRFEQTPHPLRSPVPGLTAANGMGRPGGKLCVGCRGV